MTAIEASSAGVRDMADGSLRITLEFEPRHAREAYALFGARGTPVAVAALKVGHAAVQESGKPKGGALAREAGILCARADFQEWLMVASEEAAAALIREVCEIESRAELDTDATAGKRFVEQFRIAFMHHKREMTA